MQNCTCLLDKSLKSRRNRIKKIRCFVRGERLGGWHRRIGSEGGPRNGGSLQKKIPTACPRREFHRRKAREQKSNDWRALGDSPGKEGDPRTGVREARTSSAAAAAEPSEAEPGRGCALRAPGTGGLRTGPRAAGRMEGGRETPGAGSAGLGQGGLCTRLQGSGSATHLSELESRDDGDNDAHEADVEPIPVGQAGIGLSLQELEQHHPGPATPRREEPTPAAHRRATASASRHSRPRLAHSPRPPRMVAPATDSPLGSTPRPPLPGARSPRPRRGGGGPAARKAAGAARVGLREAAAGRQRHLAGGGARAGARPPICACAAGSALWAPRDQACGTHPVQQVTN